MKQRHKRTWRAEATSDFTAQGGELALKRCPIEGCATRHLVQLTHDNQVVQHQLHIWTQGNSRHGANGLSWANQLITCLQGKQAQNEPILQQTLAKCSESVAMHLYYRRLLWLSILLCCWQSAGKPAIALTILIGRPTCTLCGVCTRSSLLPSPSCPNLFHPQAHRAPVLSAANMCRQPPATSSTPAKPGTCRGSLASLHRSDISCSRAGYEC